MHLQAQQIMSVIPQNAANQINVSAEANEHPELEMDRGWT